MADKLYTREQIVRKLRDLRRQYRLRSIDPELSSQRTWFLAKEAAFAQAIAAFPPKKAGK